MNVVVVFWLFFFCLIFYFHVFFYWVFTFEYGGGELFLVTLRRDIGFRCILAVTVTTTVTMVGSDRVGRFSYTVIAGMSGFIADGSFLRCN